MILDSFLVDIIYHTDRFATVEQSLHPRDESHLVMMDNPFNVLLDPVRFWTDVFSFSLVSKNCLISFLIPWFTQSFLSRLVLSFQVFEFLPNFSL